MTVPQAELDQLYEAPLDQFTTTRKDLVRKLRADGDRAAADELARLRKPSVASWGLNRLRRRHPGRVDELLAAGDRLREAQQRLLSSGDRGALRDAAINERRLVSELVELGARELGEAGHPVTAAVQNRLQETLHSAAGNAEARELLKLFPSQQVCSRRHVCRLETSLL